MTEGDLKARYEAEKPVYRAWGTYVRDVLCTRIAEEVGTQNQFGELIKIPVEPRVKAVKSLIEKAFYRDKNYDDPYKEITDKVGIRFVVLLQRDIEAICNIVEDVDAWEASKDRDHEQEKLDDPVRFEYQSVHYVVRACNDTRCDEREVPAGTPCEIQIRTLLQHAYSELTHNTVYKPKSSATPEIHRAVAKSMALIEATGDVFNDVAEKLDAMDAQFRNIIAGLTEVYKDIAEPDLNEEMNIFILDALKPLLEDVQLENLRQFLEAKPYIGERIRERGETNLLFRQPVVILLYYLISENRFGLLREWPLTEKEIAPIYTDLGIAMHPA